MTDVMSAAPAAGRRAADPGWARTALLTMWRIWKRSTSNSTFTSRVASSRRDDSH